MTTIAHTAHFTVHPDVLEALAGRVSRSDMDALGIPGAVWIPDATELIVDAFDVINALTTVADEAAEPTVDPTLTERDPMTRLAANVALELGVPLDEIWQARDLVTDLDGYCNPEASMWLTPMGRHFWVSISDLADLGWTWDKISENQRSHYEAIHTSLPL